MRRRIARDERGVAMTEFALVLPLFVLLIVGILQFGRIFFYWIEANHLANEAARWAVVDRNPYLPQTLQQHVRDSATTEFQSDVKVCIDFPDTNGAQIGNRVRVRVQKPFNFVPIFFGSAFQVQIRGSSTMRIERFGAPTGPTSYSAGSPYGACS